MSNKHRIDLFKMECLFENFKGKPVIILATGTITIPFFVKKFDWAYGKDQVCFGEIENTDNWFFLDYEDIKSIWYEYDNFTHEDRVLFVTEFDIFRTEFEVVFDCSFEKIG